MCYLSKFIIIFVQSFGMHGAECVSTLWNPCAVYTVLSYSKESIRSYTLLIVQHHRALPSP